MLETNDPSPRANTAEPQYPHSADDISDIEKPHLHANTAPKEMDWKAIDDLQLSLRHMGVPVRIIEEIGDYLHGENVVIPDADLGWPGVKGALERFASDNADEPVGERAAMLLL